MDLDLKIDSQLLSLIVNWKIARFYFCERSGYFFVLKKCLLRVSLFRDWLRFLPSYFKSRDTFWLRQNSDVAAFLIRYASDCDSIAARCNGSARSSVDLNDRKRNRGLHHGVTYANWLLNGPMEIYGNMPGSRPRALTARGRRAAAITASLANKATRFDGGRHPSLRMHAIEC